MQWLYLVCLMGVRLEINDQAFLQHVAQATNVGIVRATTFFHSQAKLALNVANTGVRVDADSVRKQAAAQLKPLHNKGLIRVKAERKWKDAQGKKQKEDVEAWYWFDAKNFEDRTDKNGKTRSVKSVTIYPYPSKPGEAPRKRTGWLQRHVLMEFAKNRVGNQELMASRTGVGRNAIYGLYLELGTRNAKARPWLVATLLKHQSMIAQQLAAQS